MRTILNRLSEFVKVLKRIKGNLKYFTEYNLYERETQRTFELTDKIIEDVIFEYEEDKQLIQNIEILDEKKTLELLKERVKSFCRFGDGEIGIIQGRDQPFQEYDKKLADRLLRILTEPNKEMYIGINRAYFHSPLIYSDENRKFYRTYGTDYRRFFLKFCNRENTYIDAGFLTAYYRFDDKYDYKTHYENMIDLIRDKKIALVCGEGILDGLEYNIFEFAEDLTILYGPKKNAYQDYDLILNKILNEISDNYIICIILGMTAKVLVYDLTQKGYIAWDVGHLAKDYNEYMIKADKNAENIKRFWAPD